MSRAENSTQWPYPMPGSGRDIITWLTAAPDQSIFREYDIRGRVDAPDTVPAMNEGTVGRIGRAFGTLLRARNIRKVTVGYDSRSYSPGLANALMLGLLATGVDVIHIGLATTPMLYYSQHVLGGTAGVSVTASHNPNGWAGLKLGYSPSNTLGPDDLEHLKALVLNAEFAEGAGTYEEHSITQAYIDDLASRLPAHRAMKVVIDGGNSISGPVAELALRAAGYQVKTINRELDWTFPNHEPDPETVAARDQIAAAVADNDADIGLSFDGDGDRLGVTDENGTVVWSDRVLAILAQDVLTRHPGAQIVFDVKCSRLVPETITKFGGEPLMWKTGHSHIKSKMRELGTPFAGERSGHFFDAGDYLGYDDGLYAGLRLLHILSNGTKPISERVREYGTYYSSPAMQAYCPDETKYDVVEQFASFADKLGASDLVRINGVRAEFPDGWLLVRASSNLPALVILAEATNQERLDEFYQILREGLVGSGLVGSEWENDPWNHEDSAK